MIIVSLDPGGETGYVVFDYDVARGSGGIGTYGHLGPTPHHYKLRTLLEECNKWGQEMFVVYERFDPRTNDFARQVSLEYIGVVKEFNQATGVPIVAQGSSIKPKSLKPADQAKGWSTDAKIEALGLMIKPKTRWKHANDAMRHLAYFVCHNPVAPTQLRDAFFQTLREKQLS